MQVALASKKDRKGAKRKITWGNHLLLVAEMLDAVLAAQKATKKQAAGKGSNGKKRKAEVLESSSDEYESYSEHEMDEKVNMLDCIEVES